MPYRVAVGLGMRQGELLGLSWNAVDFEAQTITVRRALYRYGGAYHHHEPKTQKSRRVIAVPEALMDGLRQHRTRQLEERLRLRPAGTGNDFDLVFVRPDGLPLSNGTLIKQFRRLLTQSGLPRCRFHDLRHSAASFMLAEGVAMRVISEVLGHADSAITSRVYAHVASDLQARSDRPRRCPPPGVIVTPWLSTWLSNRASQPPAGAREDLSYLGHNTRRGGRVVEGDGLENR